MLRFEIENFDGTRNQRVDVESYFINFDNGKLVTVFEECAGFRGANLDFCREIYKEICDNESSFNKLEELGLSSMSEVYPYFKLTPYLYWLADKRTEALSIIVTAYPYEVRQWLPVQLIQGVNDHCVGTLKDIHASEEGIDNETRKELSSSAIVSRAKSSLKTNQDQS